MNHKGFTLIELVMVIVLLGIIAVVVVPRLPNVTGSKAGSFVDKLRADIRYAQNLAMTQNKRYRVYYNSNPAGAGAAPVPPIPNPGYGVVFDTSGGTWASTAYARDPAGGGDMSVALFTGDYAGITISSPASGYIEFDSLGNPTVGGGVTITVSANGTAAGTVTVTAQTGAVN